MSASDIISRLPESFDNARAVGDLLFFPSTTYTHQEIGVDFEIRICPALQRKPALPTPHFIAEDKQLEKAVRVSDPFLPPYIPGLYLGELRDEEEGTQYVVLFNKFSVVPHHILLITKEYHSQSSPLLPSDLVQAWSLLVAARKAGRRFFAFYNCGDLSGASQPHKHIQLIPIEDDGPPIEKLARSVNLEVANRPFALSNLPYANHVRRLPFSLASASYDEVSGTLSEAYISLLDLVISTVRRHENYPAGSPSYNVILTLEHMHLIPRLQEKHVLHDSGEEISVNALGFAGLLLVKSDKELDAVKAEGVGKILRGVGLESVHDEQIAESIGGDE